MLVVQNDQTDTTNGTLEVRFGAVGREGRSWKADAGGQRRVANADVASGN
jgi:hypothetical protein